MFKTNKKIDETTVSVAAGCGKINKARINKKAVLRN